MKVLALLLLVFAFLGNETAAYAAGLHDCCPDNSCTLVDCVSMGCAPAAAPALPASPVSSITATAVVDWLEFSPTRFESQIEEVWAPPD